MIGELRVFLIAMRIAQCAIEPIDRDEGQAIDADIIAHTGKIISRCQKLFALRRVDAIEIGMRDRRAGDRSEEHTSELQSLMRISYAVFCLKNKKIKMHYNKINHGHPHNTIHTILNTTYT